MNSIVKSTFQNELFKCINLDIKPSTLRTDNFGNLKLPKNVIIQIRKINWPRKKEFKKKITNKEA